MTQATDPTTFTAALAEAYAESQTVTGEQASGDEGAGAEQSLSHEEIQAPPAATPETYKVKVDGEEVDVTLEEALAGYQRQSSYTKGTQSLAAEKQRLAQAEAIFDLIQEDPKAAIAQLAEAFEITDFEPVDLDSLDPLEREVLELKSFKEQQIALQEAASVDAEFASLKNKYNDQDIDEVALLEHAINVGAGSLEVAYRDLKADDWLTQATAKRTADADAAAIEAKRQAAVVDGGTSRSTAGVSAGSGRPQTVREAYAAALEESKA